jgi:hypothetical protein
MLVCSSERGCVVKWLRELISFVTLHVFNTRNNPYEIFSARIWNKGILISVYFLSANKKEHDFVLYLSVTIEALSGRFYQHEIIQKDQIEILKRSIPSLVI